LSHTVVLGGGICGLAAGFSLAEHGEQVTLLEAQHFLGGLATTLRGETGAGFDFGPHAYHARNQRVLDMFKEIASDGFPARGKNVRIKFRGKYYKYPLEALDIAKSMSPLLAARAFADYTIESLRRRIRPRQLVSAQPEEPTQINAIVRTASDFEFVMTVPSLFLRLAFEDVNRTQDCDFSGVLDSEGTALLYHPEVALVAALFLLIDRGSHRTLPNFQEHACRRGYRFGVTAPHNEVANFQAKSGGFELDFERRAADAVAATLAGRDNTGLADQPQRRIDMRGGEVAFEHGPQAGNGGCAHTEYIPENPPGFKLECGYDDG